MCEFRGHHASADSNISIRGGAGSLASVITWGYTTKIQPEPKQNRNRNKKFAIKWGLVSYKQAQMMNWYGRNARVAFWSGTTELPLSSSTSVKLANALVEQVQDAHQGWGLLNRLLLQ
jgi:hypothetical protein